MAWEVVTHEGRQYHRCVRGVFYVDLAADWVEGGRPYRLVEAPTGLGMVLYEGVTADSLDRAMRTLEHMLAARAIRSTREVPRVD